MNYNRLKKSERKEKAVELLKMVDLPEEFVTKYPQWRAKTETGNSKGYFTGT